MLTLRAKLIYTQTREFVSVYQLTRSVTTSPQTWFSMTSSNMARPMALAFLLQMTPSLRHLQQHPTQKLTINFPTTGMPLLKTLFPTWSFRCSPVSTQQASKWWTSHYLLRAQLSIHFLRSWAASSLCFWFWSSWARSTPLFTVSCSRSNSAQRSRWEWWGWPTCHTGWAGSLSTRSNQRSFVWSGGAAFASMCWAMAAQDIFSYICGYSVCRALARLSFTSHFFPGLNTQDSYRCWSSFCWYLSIYRFKQRDLQV